jgi:hypothetical protein
VASLFCFGQFVLRVHLVVFCLLSEVGVSRNMNNYFRGSSMAKKFGKHCPKVIGTIARWIRGWTIRNVPNQWQI